MAKDKNKYFEIVRKLQSGDSSNISDEEILYFLETTPEIDEKVINDHIEALRKAGGDASKVDPATFKAGMIETIRQSSADPLFKQRVTSALQSKESKQISDKLSAGINLVLAGTDIANSISQIKAGDKAAKSSRRPTKPLIPQRDMYLQQALRQANEGTMDAGRALAPVQGEIQDQYLTDIQNAKTASTGQAGAFGAYAQLAADRRKRSAMELAPIQDSIRAREQARYDQLLGMRANESQQMFNNQAQFYNTDVYQYGQDQQAAAALGSVGRENLRGSLYNLGNQVAPAIGDMYSKRKYDRLRNQAKAAGLNADNIVQSRINLDGYVQPSSGFFKNPEFFDVY